MNKIKMVQLYTWGFENSDAYYSRVTTVFIRQSRTNCYVRKPQNIWVTKVKALTFPVRFTNEIRVPRSQTYIGNIYERTRRPSS